MGIFSFVYGESLAVSWRVLPGIFAGGAVSLGLSLALFYIAMKHIGAGRTGLIFLIDIMGDCRRYPSAWGSFNDERDWGRNHYPAWGRYFRLGGEQA